MLNFCPQAIKKIEREQKPVYINNDLMGGTFRRDGEGDYHCTSAQIKAMLRDQTEDTMDMILLEDVPLEELNQETIRGYRNRHRTLKEGHPFGQLENAEYLRSIGAAALSRKDGKLHPTAAGMLMFGDEYNIVRHFPEYFLDYREMLDPTIRWTDRLQSSSGEWSGNLCDFYFRVYNKIIKDVKVPFRMEGGDRIDDTPVHKALREALANCLVNADYYGTCGVVIRKEPDKLFLENPGYIRTGKKQMRLGGISDPRNKALMKMFNLINIGERAGSGVPNIFQVWEKEGWTEPVIVERFNPDRTILELRFAQKIPEKGSHRNVIENVIDISETHLQSLIPEYSAKKAAKACRIVRLIAENPRISMDEMRKTMNVADRTIARYISDLKKHGIINRVGPDNGGSWEILIFKNGK